MAPRKKKTPEDSVVVLSTHLGYPLIIRANPSDKDARGFVEEHTRRYIAGEPGGPSGCASFRIFAAKRYENELSYRAGDDPIAEIDIADLLPTL